MELWTDCAGMSRASSYRITSLSSLSPNGKGQHGGGGRKLADYRKERRATIAGVLVARGSGWQRAVVARVPVYKEGPWSGSVSFLRGSGPSSL